jgi:hypothetical protein
MRLLLFLCLCLICAEARAQTVPEPPPREMDIKIGVYRAYMPQFNVQEWSVSDVQAWGGQIRVSEFEDSPWEVGFHAQIGYGRASRLALGANFSYSVIRTSHHYFKAGVELTRIQLEDINIPGAGPGVSSVRVGDVDFDGWGSGFSPFMEWEWKILPIGSLFARAGYHILNGEKSKVMSVEELDEPPEGYNNPNQESLLRIGRKHSFFYSLAGYHANIGINVYF